MSNREYYDRMIKNTRKKINGLHEKLDYYTLQRAKMIQYDRIRGGKLSVGKANNGK